MKIPDDILVILSRCKIEDNTVFLPNTQLDRAVYQKVNKCLDSIGGKWSRKAKGHIFDYDPTEAFENLMLGGEVEDMKKKFQFFPTPHDVAAIMCSMAELTPNSYVLEPSIGKGDLADVIYKWGGCENVFGIELNGDMERYLSTKPYSSIVGVDFLTFAPDPNRKDLMPDTADITHIIMNPPFTHQQDIDHIMAAYELLPPGGILVSVASTSWQWRDNNKSVEFREWLEDLDYEVTKLPEGAFKESGTMIPTVIIKIRREGVLEKKVIGPTFTETTEPTVEPKPKGEFSMITNISIDKIISHPNNPRKDLGELNELSDSISAMGIMQNLTVVPVDIEDYKRKKASKKAYTGDYTIIIGHRRAAAARLAGLTEVPCAVVEMDEKTQVATMLLENMQRSDLTVYEQAQGFQLMLDFGESITTIKEKTGFSETTIRRRVKLLDLDAEKFSETQKRNVSLEDYALLDQVKDISLKNEVLEHLGTNNFKWKLDKAVEKEKQAEAQAKIIEILETFATKVEDREGYSAQYLSPYRYDSFEVPEDAAEVQYYYCVHKNGDMYLLQESEDEEDEEDEAKRQAEEKRKERESALKSVHRQAYKLRMDFAKSVKGNPKGQDAIERMAASVMLQGNGYMQEKPTGDYYGIKGGYKPSYNAKEGDERETFNDFKKRIPEIESGETGIKCLFAATYLKLENDGHSYFRNWHLDHINNSTLNKLYEFLCALGYEMSDEEKQLQDGTHPLFVKDEETDSNCSNCVHWNDEAHEGLECAFGIETGKACEEYECRDEDDEPEEDLEGGDDE